MAITVVKDQGPVCMIGVKMATYNLALDNSWLAAGEAIDLTGEFTYVLNATIGAVDAIADAAVKFELIFDSDAVITSSNVLVGAYVTSTDTAVADAVDLSSIGELRLTVWGK